jgi:murein tripeptide amidase MpaA
MTAKLIALIAALASGQAVAAGPWDSNILPPAPPWKGASERLVVRQDNPWITPSEMSGLTRTPSYGETRAWLERLDAASPLIRLETYGKSPEGRDLILVIASQDGEALEPAKPVFLAQAGIHAGEIDGKDAGLMLLRDIAFGGKQGLIDHVNLAFVPMVNPDGHERSSRFSRPNQRGPEEQGWRTTAWNLNLNRDYGKLDSPEIRGMIGLVQRFDPALYMDIHVTDGIDYQYDITFGFEGYDGRFARSRAIGAWLDSRFRPAAEKALTAAGHIPGQLVFAVDDRAPRQGLGIGPSPLRFSTGYGDAAHVPTVLVENHSLKPYRQRVLGTYVLLEATLKALAADPGGAAIAKAQDRAMRPAAIPTAWKVNDRPTGEADFRAIAYETYPSPASGRDEIRWLGRPDGIWKMPLFDSHPAISLTPAAAWWVPASRSDIIERLRRHGVAMETLAAPRTLSLEMAHLDSAKLGGRVNEGRAPMEAGPARWKQEAVTLPAGSVRVATDQPLGTLASLLLDPASEESFLAWGFFPEILQRTEYIEGYAIAPLAERMLAVDPALKSAFEAKLAADPAFAADPDARLGWFYDQTPYRDARYRLYPVGRETASAAGQ